MTNDELYEMTRKFLLGENKDSPTLRGYMESIKEFLDNASPGSLKESKKLAVAKENLFMAHRIANKLEEKVFVLEEQVKVLEEGKN